MQEYSKIKEYARQDKKVLIIAPKFSNILICLKGILVHEL